LFSRQRKISTVLFVVVNNNTPTPTDSEQIAGTLILLLIVLLDTFPLFVVGSTKVLLQTICGEVRLRIHRTIELKRNIPMCETGPAA
jgi:hypothetical protein